MYLTFFGLREKPFNLTPDPKFLFLTPAHREALAQLLYGVKEQKGFMVLTGEVGTGKTTLLRTLLQRLDSTSAAAFVPHSTLPFDGLLEYVLEDLGAANGQQSMAQRLITLNHLLIERRRMGQHVILIFDEAQHLDHQTLEQIRLLSNFETTTDKPLQIILAGQPELATKLQLPALRQLRQRIGLRCHIVGLTPDETRHYIWARLRIAGARDLTLFSERAIRRIAEYANGIPRVVNLLCDHSLVIGYAEQTRKIDRQTVDQAIRYLEDDPLASRRPRRLRLQPAVAGRWMLGGFIGAVVGVGITALGLSIFGNLPIELVSYAERVWQSVWGLVAG